MIEEKWEVFDIFDKYEVSTWGRVRKNKSKKIINVFREKKPTFRYSVCGNNRAILVSRLVASVFIGGELFDDTMVVRHKDGNIRNNHVDNLEWVSKSELQSSVMRDSRVWETSPYLGNPPSRKKTTDNNNN